MGTRVSKRRDRSRFAENFMDQRNAYTVAFGAICGSYAYSLLNLSLAQFLVGNSDINNSR